MGFERADCCFSNSSSGFLVADLGLDSGSSIPSSFSIASWDSAGEGMGRGSRRNSSSFQFLFGVQLGKEWVEDLEEIPYLP